MAATDKPYRNQRTLDIVFAVSCILMLVSTLWMLYADYNREFKAVQRNFRDVESVLNERQMISQLPDPAEVERLQKVVLEKRKAVDAARDKVKGEDQRLTAERDTRSATFRSIKADFDSKSSFYNIDVEERDQPGILKEVRKERAERVEARKTELKDIGDSLDKAQKAVDEADAEYRDKVTKPVADAENELADAEDAMKKTTAAFDRFAKLTVQKDWGLGDSFRALPILDGFESPTKIKQIVLNDLPIEYGSFKYVTRYDRCTSCHLGIDRAAGFDHSTLTKLTRSEKQAGAAWREAALTASNSIAALAGAASEDDRAAATANLQKVQALLEADARGSDKSADPYAVVAGLKKVLSELRSSEVPGTAYGKVDEQLAHLKDLTDQYEEAKSLPKKLETARRILQDRKNHGEILGFDPGDLPSHARTVNLTPGQVTQFASHPRLDLFVDSNSPHPMEKFGCSICHAGQGSATDFGLSAHTPADAHQQQEWEKTYHWHDSHDWEFPMLSSRFVESSCLKCHHEVTDLVRQGSREEAPKLMRGFNLVRENGCFGCHEIAGIKSGREIGPDLRLEPSPALDWLTATDQDRAKADPTNPPGAYRKVGPSLRRLAEKTDEEWARRWIQSPRGFRPDTKMPHFYNLSNDDLAALEATAAKDADGKIIDRGQMDFPAAEIHSIAHYLLAESRQNLEGKDTYRIALQDRLKDLQDKLKTGPLEDKERKEIIDVTHKLSDLALLSIPPRSSEIDVVAGKLRQTQDGVIENYERLSAREARVQELQKHKEIGDSTKDPKKLDADLEQAQKDRDAAKQDLENSKKDLDSQFQELKKDGLPIPLAKQLVDSEGEPIADALPDGDKD